jgi:hypothetical protein
MDRPKHKWEGLLVPSLHACSNDVGDPGMFAGPDEGMFNMCGRTGAHTRGVPTHAKVENIKR